MIAVVWLVIFTVIFISVHCIHKRRLRLYRKDYDVVLTVPSFFFFAGLVFAYICGVASIYFSYENDLLYVLFLIFSILFSSSLFSFYSCCVFCNKKELVKITWFFKQRKIELSNCDGFALDETLNIFAGDTVIRISSTMKNYCDLTALLYAELPELKKNECNVSAVRKFKDSVYDFQTYIFMLALDVFLAGLFVLFSILEPSAWGVTTLCLPFMILIPFMLYVSVTRAHKSLFWDKIARFMVKGEALKPFTPTIDALAEQMQRYKIVDLIFGGKSYKIIRESQTYNIFEVLDDSENNIFSGNLEKILHYNFVDEKSLSNNFCSCKILHIY